MILFNYERSMPIKSNGIGLGMSKSILHIVFTYHEVKGVSFFRL